MLFLEQLLLPPFRRRPRDTPLRKLSARPSTARSLCSLDFRCRRPLHRMGWPIDRCEGALPPRLRREHRTGTTDESFATARGSSAPRPAITARHASPPFGTGRVSLDLGFGPVVADVARPQSYVARASAALGFRLAASWVILVSEVGASDLSAARRLLRGQPPLRVLGTRPRL